VINFCGPWIANSVRVGAPPWLGCQMKRTPSALIGSLAMLFAALQACAAAHPPIAPGNVACSSCHADKTRGKSVHSAGELSCTLCHLVTTEGGVTTVNLAVPQQQICLACHEPSTEWQPNVPAMKGPCLDCHDAHSSSHFFLLREGADARRQIQSLRSLRGKQEPATGRAVP